MSQSTSRKNSVSKNKEKNEANSGDGDKCPCPSDRGKSLCPQCSKDVGSNDLGLQCEICDEWHHIGCQSITELEYKFLKEHTSLHWYCMPCHHSLTTVMKNYVKLENKFDNLSRKFDADIGKMTKTIDYKVADMAKGLRSEMESLSTEVRTTKELACSTNVKLETAVEAKLVGINEQITEGISKSFESKFDDKITSLANNPAPAWTEVVNRQVDSRLSTVTQDLTRVQQSVDETKKQAEEVKDKESRRNNIILYRVPEPQFDTREVRNTQDRQFCVSLFKEGLQTDINENDIKSMFRIGKYDKDANKPRPILVELKERSLKNCIMESLPKLRDAEVKFKNLSITHDLTKTERLECKTLIDDAKTKQNNESGDYIWRVRGLPGQMKVIKIKRK